jgi:hypothetical protein
MTALPLASPRNASIQTPLQCALRRYPGKKVTVGAAAFSRTGDPATGDFSDAKVIRKFGDVSDDLSTL